jgi:hypothetical protein
MGDAGLARCEADVAPGRAARAVSGRPGVTRIVVTGFGGAVPLPVVFTHMQVEKRPTRKTEPAKRAGRSKHAGHLVLLWSYESQPDWSTDAFDVGSGWRTASDRSRPYGHQAYADVSATRNILRAGEEREVTVVVGPG